MNLSVSMNFKISLARSSVSRFHDATPANYAFIACTAAANYGYGNAHFLL